MSKTAPFRARTIWSGRTGVLYAGLVAGNALAWIWTLSAFHGRPVLLGAAGLAYLLGLRHALDADHIAAIDNVTRRLMRRGKRSETVGLYFSLGHSTVVALAALGIALLSAAVQARFAPWRGAAAIIGTSVSALFLLAIGAVNLVSLVSIWRTLRSVRCGIGASPPDLETAVVTAGPMGRVLRPLMRLIGKTWHAYPLGFLFGLGFDTASEIGLLAISASQASQGLGLGSILLFPALFAAGMSLLDTTDGVVMARLYGWAFATPIRTLYYNLGITFVSVATAMLIGAVEAARLLSAGRVGWPETLLADHSAAIGGALVAASVALLCVSVLAAHLRTARRPRN